MQHLLWGRHVYRRAVMNIEPANLSRLIQEIMDRYADKVDAAYEKTPHKRVFFCSRSSQMLSYQMAKDLNRLVRRYFSDVSFLPFGKKCTPYSIPSFQVLLAPETSIRYYLEDGRWSHSAQSIVELLKDRDTEASKRHDPAQKLMAELLQKAKLTGFNAVPKGTATVQMLLPNDVYILLDRLNSRHIHLNYFMAYRPGEGGGSKAMRMITDLADQYKVTLSLDACPLDLADFDWPYAKMNVHAPVAPLSRLLDFYRAHGFHAEDDDGEDICSMVREPNA